MQPSYLKKTAVIALALLSIGNSLSSMQRRVPKKPERPSVSSEILAAAEARRAEEERKWDPSREPTPEELNESLLTAIEAGTPNVVNHILDQGANINGLINPRTGEIDSLTHPLKLAISKGNITMIRLLLARGATVQDFLVGRTAQFRSAEIFRVLLEHNVPLDTTNKYQLNALNASVASPLMRAVILNDVEEVTRLLEEYNQPAQVAPTGSFLTRFFGGPQAPTPVRPTMDDQGEDGYTALHWAAARGNIYVVNLLLQRGARANITNNEGLTPAGVAYRNHHDLVGQAITVYTLANQQTNPTIAQAPATAHSSVFTTGSR
jgi:ankyrin repeat protein